MPQSQLSARRASVETFARGRHQSALRVLLALLTAGSAMFVLSNEDIRSSGATGYLRWDGESQTFGLITSLVKRGFVLRLRLDF